MSTCQDPDPHLASQVAGERCVVPAPTVAEVRVDVVGVRNRRAVALGILIKKRKMRIKKKQFFWTYYVELRRVDAVGFLSGGAP